MDIDFFINSNGRISSTKTTEKYIKKHCPDEYLLIISHSKKIGLNLCTFSEKIYHFIHKMNSPVVCENCHINKPQFNGLLKGYLRFCSNKCSNSSNNVIKKKEESYFKKFGVLNPSKSPKIKAKIQETFNKKYGGNPFSLPHFQQKIKETNKKKYGTEHPMNLNSSLWDNIDKKNKEYIYNKYKNLEIISIEPRKNGYAIILCNECKEIFSISKWNLHQRTKNRMDINPCTSCNPIGSTTNSNLENFIRNFLISNNIEYKENDRNVLNGLEIDFLLPNYKIGIETNGLYWHSDLFKEPNYHKNKTKLAKEGGYLLIHIFEDEILNTPNLVESRLKSILNLNKEIIYARNCKIEEIDSNTCNNFLAKNHLQGKSGAAKRYGLFKNNKLISVMTFGNLRINMGSKTKEDHWELIRFCTKRNISVVGGASKLLKYFIKNESPKKIISYCDARWSNGNFYSKLGFELKDWSRPNYFYFKDLLRENRFKYRKDQLIKEGYDPKKSESEIMKERGYHKIYDSGSYKFIWT